MDLYIDRDKIEPRNKHYQLRLTQTELDGLRKTADEYGIGIAELIRQMVAQVVKHVEQGQI